jgi:hypothetical protein
MRRSALLLIPLVMSILLAGCRDALPTDASLRPPATPRRVLVSGPVTPVDAGAVTSPVVTIANMQSYGYAQPRVSGDVACYTDYTSVVHWYRFSTNTGAPVESTPYRDFECGVDGNHIAFISAAPLPFLGVLDVSTSVITKIGPQLNPGPRQAAIGGSTVAYVEFASDFLTSRIRVADLTSPAVASVLSDAALPEGSPNVSPNGNVVVWERADRLLGVQTSYVMKAVRDPVTGTWGLPQLVTSYASFGEQPQPDTDDSYIVWRAPSGVGGEKDIFVQAVSGGLVMQIAIPGYESDPRIDAGVIVFDHQSSTGTNPEIMLYNILTNTLQHVSSVLAFLVNERSVDVSVLSGGDARVVWDVYDPAGVAGNVYARTFPLTTAPPPIFSFGGFQAPLNGGSGTRNAHAPVPVKFSLGGYFGLNVFAAGSPSSAPADCTSGVALGAATPTDAQPSLSYDAAIDTYTYTWRPLLAWAGNCRKLTLTFVDGTTASALVTFR